MSDTSRDHKETAQAKNKTPDDLTILGWIKVFKEIYEEVDRSRSPVEMWVAATAHFTTIGEAIRRMHFAALMQGAAHAFCWMCSFVLACQREKGTVFSLNESFSDIVACKYPLVCGHCQEAYCHCNPKLMDKQPNKATQYKQLLQKRRMLANAPDTYTVSHWFNVFDQIYGQNIHMLTLESIGFHFLEEAGEELTALRSLKQLERVHEAHIEGIDEVFLDKLATFGGVVAVYDKYVDQKPEPHKRGPEAIKARLVHAKKDMFIEFADTFSWFCSILNKISSVAQNCNDDRNREDERCHFTEDPFREELLQKYLPDGKPRCPSCQQSPCNCLFYN